MNADKLFSGERVRLNTMMKEERKWDTQEHWHFDVSPLSAIALYRDTVNILFGMRDVITLYNKVSLG